MESDVVIGMYDTEILAGFESFNNIAAVSKTIFSSSSSEIFSFTSNDKNKLKSSWS